MPELPEVAALAQYLKDRIAGHAVTRLDVASVSSLKTYDPPPTALHGGVVEDVRRHGKFLDIVVSGLHMVTHLARAGWLHYRDKLPAIPPKPGKGPIALRVHIDDESGFDLTEAGTKKGLAVYLVRQVTEVPGIARLGPDVLSVSVEEFSRIIGAERGQIKKVLTEQHVLAGIGNAYSDEILHAAKLSPFALTNRLSADQLTTLYNATQTILADAIQRSIGHRAAELKAEKRTGLRIHGRTGLPCPICGDTISEVSFADKSFQYCPTCQTAGKPLADRRLSKLLK